MKVQATHFNTTTFCPESVKSYPVWIAGCTGLFPVSKCKVEVRPLAPAKLENKKEKGDSLIGDDEKMMPSL